MVLLIFITAEVCNSIGFSGDDYKCCTSSNKCDLNQGDCDDDEECGDGLVCGTDNCQLPFPIDADCCEKQGTLICMQVKQDTNI